MSGSGARLTQKLDTLPLYILENICECIAECDLRKENLFSFSLTGKNCYLASSRQRFRSLRVTADGADRLSSDVAELTQILSHGERAAFVRQITIYGSVTDAPGTMSRVHLDKPADPETVDGGWALCNDRFFNSCRKQARSNYTRTINPTTEEKKRWELAWEPLAKLVTELTGLVDVIFEARDQFPRCLLASIHQFGPKCRLHIHTFNLFSLRFPEMDPPVVDPNDIALVTSPNLCSVVVSYRTRTAGLPDYHTIGLMMLVCELAPNLKHVCMRSYVSGQFTMAPAQAPPREWFSSKPAVKSKKAQLRSLVFDGTPDDDVDLGSWMAYSDFGCLTALEIWYPSSTQLIQKLVDTAKEKQLPSVKTLALCADTGDNPGSFDMPLNELFLALVSLESISLSGYVGKRAFTTLLRRHAAALRRLILDVKPQDFPTDTYIDDICSSCPNLRDIHLPIQRFLGRHQETKQYHSLGKLKHLQRLTLWLHIIPYGLLQECPPEQEENLTARKRDKYLYETLVNSAIDDRLSRSIFKYISSVNSAHHHRILQSLNHGELQYLRIDPRGFRDMPELDEYNVLTVELAEILAKTWICERTYGAPEGIMVRKITTNTNDAGNAEVLAEMAELSGLSDKVWRRVWPDRDGDWMNQCGSFPLVVRDTEEMDKGADI